MSFFRALFDFSFSEFITNKIIKVLYVISIIIAALASLGMIIVSFTTKEALSIIFAIILAPIVFVLWCIFSRVGYEVMIVLFQIAENVRDFTYFTTKGQKAPMGGGGGGGQPQYAPPAYPQAAYPQQPPAQPQYPQYPQYPQQPQQPPQYPPRQ